MYYKDIENYTDSKEVVYKPYNYMLIIGIPIFIILVVILIIFLMNRHKKQEDFEFRFY